MKLIFVLTFIATLHTSAGVFGQNITLSRKDASLESILREIKTQSGYDFMFNTSWLRKARPVTLDVRDAPLSNVLDLCFKDQPFTYTIISKTIVMKEREEERPLEVPRPLTLPDPPEVTGSVTGENGEPLSGATVKLKDGKVIAITDEKGHFKLKNINSNATIEISYTGYSAKKVEIGNQTSFKVSLSQTTNRLDEVQVIAYGTTTQRLSTGNVTTVTAKEIEQQPVSNALAALEGRVPGLVIAQTTGLPGGGFSVQIRGQNSILNGNDPFYVVDGVPYNSEVPAVSGNPKSPGLLNTYLMGGSPLNYINPYDIESIEVLKDADATAIYGSRAANGAILITTKKGKAGPMRLDANVNSGVTSLARDIKLLNTQQYLALRHEAFSNDGATPDPTADFDLTFWDTTRSTDWSKQFLNNHSVYTDANASVSGGNLNTQYVIGAGYNRQTSGMPVLIPKNGADQRGSAHFNLTNISADKRFKLTMTGSYVSDLNTIDPVDLSETRFSTPPDAPPLYNKDGSLNWAPMVPGQVGTWTNPLAQLNQIYKANTSNLVSNAIVGYTLLPGLELKASLGYTNTQIDEVQTSPSTTSDPANPNTPGSEIAQYGETNTHSWIVEPQANYKLNLGKGVFTALIGGSFHENDTKIQSFSGSSYTSDALLESIQAAGSLVATSRSSQYKYEAFFGRLNYDWQDKYILNLTDRRDGSSRFGPGKQFGNFGSVGAAWIFSREQVIQKNLGFLSFGKLRVSYGSTGNDQIGDYKFMDLYANTYFPYLGFQGLYPQNLFNPVLAWEIDKKLEGGIELGFLKDRITIRASIYRNRSGNQLVSTPVSMVTGFSSIPANLPAEIQNTGQELELHTTNVKLKNFTWLSYFTLTIPKNKLLAFPGLATSSYVNYYVVGKPITIKKVFHLTGVNDTTGIYQFSDFKGNPTYSPNSSTDMTSIVNTAPKYYGSFLNSFSYKEFSLDIMFQFVKQEGPSLFGAYSAFSRNIGSMFNVPVRFLDHWRKPGDKAKYEMASQSGSGDASNALNYASQSDFAYGDASFVRLKNLAISWQIPGTWKQKMHLQRCRIYINAQNLLTITKYDGIDPETQSIYSPPKKVWVAGLQVTL